MLSHRYRKKCEISGQILGERVPQQANVEDFEKCSDANEGESDQRAWVCSLDPLKKCDPQ